MASPQVLRTIDVPTCEGEYRNNKTINVFSEHGPLLVTQDEDFYKEGYRITHEASGYAFGYFTTLSNARKAAKALASLSEWANVDTSKPQPKEFGEKVVPIIHANTGRMSK